MELSQVTAVGKRPAEHQWQRESPEYSRPWTSIYTIPSKRMMTYQSTVKIFLSSSGMVATWPDLASKRFGNVSETFLFLVRVHLDKLVSTEFPIHRGVRQGDPLSPKLFTAVMEEVFKKADISEGVNVDGENLTNLRFAYDVALFNETTKQMEKTPEQSKLRKPESWLKNTQRKDKVHDKLC